MIKTFVAFTQSRNWGKGETISEALANAKFKPNEAFNLVMYTGAKPEDVTVNELGETTYPARARRYDLSGDKIENLVVTDLDLHSMFGDFVNELERKREISVPQKFWDFMFDLECKLLD